MRLMLFGLVVLCPTFASANFSSVSGTEVSEGVLTASVRSTYAMDNQNSRARWLGRIGADYGLTDHYALGLFVQGERRRHDNFELEAFIVDHRIEWHTEKDDGFKSGFRVRYTKRDGAKAPDNARLQLIVALPVGNWEARLNQLLIHELGDGAQSGILLETRGRIHYRWPNGTQLGLETINTLGRASSIQSFDNRRHEIGPALSGNLENGYTYDLAYRHGISDRATDHVIRIGLMRAF